MLSWTRGKREGRQEEKEVGDIDIWRQWLEIALGVIGLSPNVFWSMTPYEWSCCLSGHKQKTEEGFRQQMILSWWSGFYSQADLNKNSLQKLRDMIDPPEVVEKRRNSSIDKNKNLLEQIQKNRRK